MAVFLGILHATIGLEGEGCYYLICDSMLVCCGLVNVKMCSKCINIVVNV